MAGRIPQHFIDELISRVDIVDVIDSRVPLKKRGREYMACCPFHSEKTPSFTVSPEKQFYHCFGCGAHGTALGFLMEYEHMDFVEAVESLAQSLGIEVPREGGEVTRPKREFEDLYAVMEAAAEFYRQQLRHSTRAIDYLKGRGLSGQIAADYGMGYAPAGWDGLLQHLGRDAVGAMHKAGLLIQRDSGGFYDRFRDRVMFPIRDRRGRTIAFGGRIIDDGTPKYLNSPETPIFHKGRELYGLYEARKASTKLERILVVEGYMDVIALAQNGITNAVATLGTATTEEHLSTLFRVVPSVVFCFDGDRAGRQAAWRALEHALPVLRDGLEAYFLFLPEGEDPDTLVRQLGREGFEARVDGAMGLSDFLIAGLRERHNVLSHEGRAHLADDARKLLKPLPPGFLREQLLSELARLLNLPPERLEKHLEAPEEPLPAPRQARPQGTHQIQMNPVRLALALALIQPDLASELEALPALESPDIPGSALLAEVLETARQNPHLTSAAMIERWRERQEYPHLLKLMEWEPAASDSATLRRMFLDAIARLVSKRAELRTEYLLHKSRVEELDPEEKAELQTLLQHRGGR
jgi:DNA primase